MSGTEDICDAQAASGHMPADGGGNELCMAAGVLGSVAGSPHAAHKLLSAHSSRLRSAQQRLLKPQNAGKLIPRILPSCRNHGLEVRQVLQHLCSLAYMASLRMFVLHNWLTPAISPRNHCPIADIEVKQKAAAALTFNDTVPVTARQAAAMRMAQSQQEHWRRALFRLWPGLQMIWQLCLRMTPPSCHPCSSPGPSRCA